MEKILYLMNVDWNWIKQRPHFLAEELNKHFEVIVINQRRYSKKGFQKRDYDGKMLQINTIPRIDRYSYLKWINTFIKQRFVSNVIKREKPDYIYVTLPDQIKWLPKDYNGKIIYDCMDDHIGLSRDAYRKQELKRDESELLTRADYIMATSEYLKDILYKRYGHESISSKLSVVRNAFGGDILDNVRNQRNDNQLKIGYFGTISDWFDFDLLVKSIKDLEFVSYKLIGPLHRGTVIPQQDRIEYIGTVEHDELYEVTRDIDVLIMPFKLDESIKAVDPVKLYEYINFDKNIICVEYNEVKRFGDYVYFYNDLVEFENALTMIYESCSIKYSETDRIRFLEENTWTKRAEEIINATRGK